MSKLLGVIVLITTFSLSAAQTELQRELSTQLSFAVKTINTSVPKLIDDDTRLDSAATFKNYLIYNHTMVNYSFEELDISSLDKILEEVVIAPLCKNKDLSAFIDGKVILVYRYLGKNGNFLTEISKDMSTCKTT